MRQIHRLQPKFSFLQEKDCQKLHDATLEVLRRTGCRVQDDEALELLRSAGAIVEGDNLVKFPSQLVEWALGKAPSSITLCLRSSDCPGAILQKGRVHFGTGSDTVNLHHPIEGRRKFQLADVAACARMVDSLPQLDFCMSMGIPSDIEPEHQYVNQYATLVQNTTKPIVFVCDTKEQCETIVEIASVVAGSREKLRLNPTLLLYSEPITPLTHNKTSTQKLLFMAREGLPIVHSPAPMMGGTAPVTLAGGLVMANAEVLSSLVMHQLTRDGAPFVYGAGVHHLDMKTTISVYGAPEFQLARGGVVDMARYYGLPSWGYAGCSDAPVMGPQAAMDATYQVRDALQMGANLVHDVGYIEAGIAFSPELVVLTAELIDMHRHFMDGFELSHETLALDVIDKVGPGGSFLATEHTMNHFKDYWFPKLFERRRYEKWEKAGKPSFSERLKEKTMALLEEKETEALSGNVLREIERILP